MKNFFKQYDWVNTSFLFLSPIASILGICWLYSQPGSHWGSWILAGVMLYATGLGITGGYHRLLSHKSFEAHPVIKVILTLLAGASFEGSARDWCSDHRTHHQFVDTEKDPYNIQKGFWHAHMGWVIKALPAPRTFDNIKDLDKDPFILFQHKYYFLLAVSLGFAFPTLLAWTWGDPWGGFFIAGMARVVFNHHATFCINSVCHTLGSQPYSTRHSSRDSWIAAVLTYGEGYHNFHHEFPGDYRNGLKPYHFDPGKWLIDLCAKMKLAWNLKKARPETIFKTRLAVEQEKALQKAARASTTIARRLEPMLLKTRARVEEAHVRFVKMQEEYYRLKKEKMDRVHVKIDQIKTDMAQAQEHFEQIFAEWQVLVNQYAIA